MKYIVTQFGVDQNFNEYDKPIWSGEASSGEDAINQASMIWPEDRREFMKGYLKAHRPWLN